MVQLPGQRQKTRDNDYHKRRRQKQLRRLFRMVPKTRPHAVSPINATHLTGTNGHKVQFGQALIELHHVTKSYPMADGEFFALNDVSFDVYPGEFLGVIGKSGAGKSTLLNMISGVDHLTQGSVVVRANGNGPVSVHELSESKLALWRGRNLGIVYQSFQLLPMLDLVENVVLPMDMSGTYQGNASRQKAMELLRLVDIEEHASKLPSAISGGQQQRVAIARALANDPQILIADEPTGSLDSNTADMIFKIFEDLVEKGKTIVMVTHDNSLAPRFTRRIMIADGQLLGASDYAPVAA